MTMLATETSRKPVVKTEILPIEYSRTPVRNEPELDAMDEAVRIINEVYATKGYGPVRTPQRSFCGATLTAEQEARIVDRKIKILKRAVRISSDSKVHFAIYVFALFRFELTMKHLTWLTGSLPETGTRLRAVSEAARRARNPHYR